MSISQITLPMAHGAMMTTQHLWSLRSLTDDLPGQLQAQCVQYVQLQQQQSGQDLLHPRKVLLKKSLLYLKQKQDLKL